MWSEFWGGINPLIPPLVYAPASSFQFHIRLILLKTYINYQYHTILFSYNINLQNIDKYIRQHRPTYSWI